MNFLRRDAIVITGGSGFLGALVAASVLVEDSAVVVLPVRPHHDANDVLWHIRFGVSTLGREFNEDHNKRLRLIPVSSPHEIGNGRHSLDDLRVAEVIHCAGCLDYFDAPMLVEVNVNLTQRMIECARKWGVTRFTYLSTAYSSGYIDGVAPEAGHAPPARDPTDYARTKREAEWLVADSGLAFHILRPSIVVGTGGSGQYTGKRYGAYQLWNGLERLMCRKWIPVLHVVAPSRKVHFVHQDSFQRAFLASRRWLPDNSYLHITTPAEDAPTMRELWDLWIRDCARPERVIYYDRPDELPMREIDTRQRAFLSLAWTNLEIASSHWAFATENLQRLRGQGLDFQDVTIASLEVCQRRFIEESETIRTFLQQYERQMPAWPPVQLNFAGA